jgi:hypothetical protein
MSKVLKVSDLKAELGKVLNALEGVPDYVEVYEGDTNGLYPIEVQNNAYYEALGKEYAELKKRRAAGFFKKLSVGQFDEAINVINKSIVGDLTPTTKKNVFLLNPVFGKIIEKPL